MRYKCATNFSFFCIFAPVTFNIHDMIQIIARGSKDRLNLYVRVFKRNVINNAVRTGITLGKEDWENIDTILHNAAEARKTGNTVMIRDSLALNLWDVIIGLDQMLEDGDLTLEKARRYINSIIKKDAIERIEKQKVQEIKMLAEAERMTLKQWIREFIRQCETGERLKRKSTRMVTPSTIKNYKGTLAQLEEYEKITHHVIDFDDMTMDFYDDWKQFFIKKQYSPNTIGRHIRNLKIFLYAAKDMKLTTTNEFESSRFSADREDVDNVYLTEDRVAQMYDFNPTDRKQLDELISRAPVKERAILRELTEKSTSRRLLEEAKDIFVVGCLTGQRVSDYKRISEEMVVRLRDGKEYVQLIQEKTDKEVFLPLDIRVHRILNKYGGKLPKIYDQHLNERIKVVGRLLGWTEKAGIMEHRGIMAIRSRKKFYECIKTHTARRTFATNAYKNGISLSSIMAVTGHSSEQMLRKYLKLDNKERAIMAAAEFGNMMKKAE